MRIVQQNEKKRIDPDKKFLVELSLVELAAISALAGNSNSMSTAELVEAQFSVDNEASELLAHEIRQNPVNSGLYRVSDELVWKELAENE